MLDFLIAGSGLTGATIARQLHDAGHSVLVVDRREHAGGNVHDHLEHGIRIHTYGPHYFRTNHDRIWQWVNRWADWYRYEPCLLTRVDGVLERWPVPASKLPAGWQPSDRKPSTFEDACLAMMPANIYERYVKGYTEKQWGKPATQLAPELAGRFNVAPDDDPRLMAHRHQGLPVDGYSQFMASLLDGIPLELGVDVLREWPPHRHLVFTGPIDEYHRYRLGRLEYRAQSRTHQWHTERQQPCGQVNNPGEGEHVRTLEWVHMMQPHEQANITGSVTTTETPSTPRDPDAFEYPVPDTKNRELYQRYKAIPTPGVTICGRLGEYRYYDMDMAIGRSLRIASRLIGASSGQSEAPPSRDRGRCGASAGR